MPYQVNLKPKVLKILATINEPYYSGIKRAIYNLGNNPRPFGHIKLKGINGYRIRVGNYRIIYEIIDAKVVINIINIGHRKNIYD